jgi:hypothetical protein
MLKTLAITSATCLALCATLTPDVAQACGGFFCGRQPVDQTAERILFAVGESSSGVRPLYFSKLCTCSSISLASPVRKPWCTN